MSLSESPPPFHARLVATIILFLIVRAGASAGIIIVDGTLPADCTTRYNPATRTCGDGTYTAYRTIRAAADLAVPGDTVIIRGATYNEQLAPKNSGTENHPIIYSNAGGERVIITGAALAPAIWIYRLGYIIVQGIHVSDVQRWLAVLGSTHITIQSNEFLNANDAGGSSKTGLFFQESEYCVIRDNRIDNSTQDNIALVGSNHNLVEGNRVTSAAHTLWAIKCGNYNVIRWNYFDNHRQKIGEIYDCDGVGYGDLGFEKITRLDDTKHNVVEGNIFAYTSTPSDASPYAGIQHAGQHCIIRRNIFHTCIGPPIDLTLYADEARNTYGNRIYNNVFYDNQFGGISISGVGGSDYHFADNTCRNNIFYHNRFTRHDNRWAWYATLDGNPVQIVTGRTADVMFERNDLYDSSPDQPWTIAYGDRTSSTNPPQHPLSWWEINYPAMFTRNLQIDPAFADTAALDFRLKPASPLIDAGSFLAKTVAAGTGTTMRLDSADYFRDGYGIANLPGDTIQLEGSAERRVIIAIDYSINTLTLDAPLTWAAGQRVGLAYDGTAPDIGRFEMPAPAEAATEHYDDRISLAPNPTTGRCVVQFPSTERMTPGIRVIDIYGTIVYSEARRPTDARGKCAIDLANLPAGLYIVVIEIEGRVSSRICVRK
ncbi:MAG: type sorting protein [Chlorobi bacterium]|nr:type sorting protein [Chlorobiota bacterium]